MRRHWNTAVWFALLLSLLLGWAGWAQEGPAYLVKDIEPTDVPFGLVAEDGSLSY